MVLHDAIKTIKNRVFPFSLKKEQNLASFKKKQKNRWVGFFLKHPGFSQPWSHTTLHNHIVQVVLSNGAPLFILLSYV